MSQLVSLLEELCSGEGSCATAISGLFLTRYSKAEVPRTSLSEAVFCCVAQGQKSILLNEQRVIYDPNTYLLVSLDLPLVGQIERASLAQPFLGISLVLDFDEIASLARESDLPRENDPAPLPGLVVAPMNTDLLEAITRLVTLLKKPEQIAVLAPLVKREIFYKLLLGERGGPLRQMSADNSKVRRVAAGLAWIRRNAARSIRMEELAREMGMSSSSMHSWFRAVTGMSPLQYQKQLRLQEARRRLLSDGLDAATVSRQVGYESASQFSREYRRFFGAPPMQDIDRLRTAYTTSG